MRAGSVRSLFPSSPSERPAGRMIVCPGCGERVEIIEIRLSGTGASMRPDVCGPCQPIAHRLEPVVEVNP